MQNQLLKSFMSLLLLSLLVTVGVAAQTPQPPTSPLDLVVEALPTAPLLSQDVLAPGCELTSAEAGVFQVMCNDDVPPTTSIPTVDGERLASGCELTNPEAGVFILDCTSDPAVPMVTGDRLAPGCELTSAEAGVFIVVCDEDVPPTTSIPTVNGELMAQGCELTNPEVGVYILDCQTEPFEPIPLSPAPLTIQPGSIGNNPPLDRAPQAGVCDGAAGSYMEPGMEAIRR